MNKKSRVGNMKTSSGKAAPNQFIITDQAGGRTFQSYNTVIAYKPPNGGGRVLLDREKWDCSTTTGRYRNQFLGETKAETARKIEAGEYVLADLNE